MTTVEIDGMALGIKEKKDGLPPVYKYREGKLICDELTFIRAVNLASEREYAQGYIVGYYGKFISC